MDADKGWDRERLLNTSKDKLVDLLLLQMRNIWSEDGLYFVGIEKRFGLDAAIEIDREVWSVMGKLEAQRLKKTLNITDTGMPELFEALKHTSWWLDLDNKEFKLEDERAMITNRNCRVQLKRIEKGFGEFDCKSIRWGFLKNFVKEFNPNIEVDCHFCPLDKHPEDIWCEWEFIIR